MKCSLCSFQALSKSNLMSHLNSVHFKDKEYMCRLCHFKTAYKGALTRHVNSVHLRTGAVKECPICAYTTCSLLTLNSHLSSKHFLDIAMAFTRPCQSMLSDHKRLENNARRVQDDATSADSDAGHQFKGDSNILFRLSSQPHSALPIPTLPDTLRMEPRLVDNSCYPTSSTANDISNTLVLPLNLVNRRPKAAAAEEDDDECAIDMVIKKVDKADYIPRRSLPGPISTTSDVDTLVRRGDPSLMMSSGNLAVAYRCT